MNHLPACSAQRPASLRGFSLLELLVVISIIAALSAGMIPAISAIKTGQGISKSSFDLAGLLEQARAQAMAKNTYVYVGLSSVKVNSAVLESDAAAGDLAVAVMTTKSGVRPVLTDGSELVPLCPIRKFNNIQISTIGYEGNLNRASGSQVVNMADDSVVSFAQFSSTSPGGGQLNFEKVLEFDPRGVVRVLKKDGIEDLIEIPLKQTQGDEGKTAALQVDGVTGSVRIYRP